MQYRDTGHYYSTPLSTYIMEFQSVFAKEDFDILLEHCKWDHAIELIPGAEPKSSKVYSLSTLEQAELDAFCKGTPNTPLWSPFQSSGATRKPIQYYYVILGFTPIIPRALHCHPVPFPCSDPGYQCRDAKAL